MRCSGSTTGSSTSARHSSEPGVGVLTIGVVSAPVPMLLGACKQFELDVVRIPKHDHRGARDTERVGDRRERHAELVEPATPTLQLFATWHRERQMVQPVFRFVERSLRRGPVLDEAEAGIEPRMPKEDLPAFGVCVSQLTDSLEAQYVLIPPGASFPVGHA